MWHLIASIIVPVAADEIGPEFSKGTVQGRVYDRHTGEGITGMALSATLSNDYGLPPIQDAVTDKSGHFLFQCHFRHEVDGRVTKDQEVAVFVNPAEGSPYHEGVVQSLKVTTTALHCDIGLRQNGVVRGTVRDQLGRPVAGAAVQYWNVKPEAEGGEIVRTDKNGNFYSHQAVVAPETGLAKYRIQVIAPGYSTFEGPFTARQRYAPQDEKWIAATLVPWATIKVHVTCRHRIPEYITVFPQDAARQDITRHLFDDPELPEEKEGISGTGFCVLHVNAPQTHYLRIAAADAVDACFPVAPKPGETLDMRYDLAPYPYGLVRGRVLDLDGHPVAGAYIELRRPDESETETAATTDRNGYYFAKKVVPAKDYYVAAGLPGGGRVSSGPARSHIRVRPRGTTFVNLCGDAEPPRAEFETKLSGSTVKGILKIRLRASDNVSLAQASLGLGGTDGAWQSIVPEAVWSAPFTQRVKYRKIRKRVLTFTWNSRTVGDGWTHLKFSVYDVAGNSTSKYLRLNVRNGIPPTHPKPTPKPTGPVSY